MGDAGDTPQLVPRLCHIVRWPDFNGYGFNLHAEKGKAGQFIGKVDEGSPAEAAGLKQGDRIVEVNGTNIGNENHQQVVGRIKAGGDETRLLVVDAETDQYYKDEKKVVRGDLPEVCFLTAARDKQIDAEEKPDRKEVTFAEMESPGAEPPATIASVNNNNDTNSDNGSTGDESARYPPRLCHLCKWADFDGYGFNLHAEKDKPGQYIGSIDPDSPAETGGLKENDRIVEVNGENIESQTHSVVIQKIKAGGDRTSMLVVDREADQYYKSRGMTVSSRMSNVVVISTPPRGAETETITAAVSETVESVPEPEPENVQNGTEEEDFPPPVEDDVAEAVAAVAVDDDDEVAATEVGGGEAEVNAYEEVSVTQTTFTSSSYGDEIGSASNGINGGSESSVPEPTPAPEPEPSREPEPAVIGSTVTSTTTTTTAGGDDLNLHLSAAEMKERLRNRKKQDPRLQKQSFEAKHKMFERM